MPAAYCLDMYNGEQTHYESEVAPYVDWARSFMEKNKGGSYTDILGQVAMRKPKAIVAFNSLWAEEAVETEDEPFQVFNYLNDVGKEIFAFTEKLGQRTGIGERAFAEAHTQAMMAWQTQAFRTSGRHTFRPSPGLSQQLMLTELRGIKGEDLKLPFRSIYIEVPTDLGFQCWTAAGPWPVAGMYVTADVAKRNLADEEELVGLRLMFVSPKEGDRLSHYFMPIKQDEPLDKQLEDFTDYVQITKLSRQERNLPEDDDEMREVAEEWRALFRWMMNLVFYATSPACEFEHIEGNAAARKLWARIDKLDRSPKNKKRKRLMAEHNKLQKLPRILLGRSIKVDRLMPQTTRESRGPGSPLTVRTLVSGHWQRYATGKGRTERVWKYRQPFWRGPEDAPVAESTTHELGSE